MYGFYDWMQTTDMDIVNLNLYQKFDFETRHEFRLINSSREINETIKDYCVKLNVFFL